MSIKVYHYGSLTQTERDELNGPNGGWDSSPRFSRYADITGGFADTATVMKALLEGEYHAVAVVNGGKDSAFASTQHISESWMEVAKNASIHSVIVLPGDHRSTSVGDIMEDTETGELFIVASCGFEKLG